MKQDASADQPAAPEDEASAARAKGWAEGPAAEELPASTRRGWVEGPASSELTFDPDRGGQPDMYSTGAISLPEGQVPEQEIPPGTILAGKYRVVGVIGKGGMGIVVEARHEQLDTRVAIKILLREFMASPEASSRFLREARAASRLESQHVARVSDVGTLSTGEPYMVMEYLAGEDLAYHVDTHGALGIPDAIDYVTQACDAIAEAHTLGIVHRDVKPANLFLTKRGDSAVIKVLDFGVSKVAGDASNEMSLTHTTTIVGSAYYMSPEQMQSAKNVDRRTDVYALGVCLFELLTTELPYFADTFPELCAKIFTQPPRPLRELRPYAPEGLEEALVKTLAREPDKRFQSVPEFVQALSPWARPATRLLMANLLQRFAPQLELLPVAEPSKGPSSLKGAAKPASVKAPAVEEKKEPEKEPEQKRKPLLFIGLGAAVALAAGGAGAWAMFRAPEQPPQTMTNVEVAPPQPTTVAAPVETAAPTNTAEPAGSAMPTTFDATDAGPGTDADAGKDDKDAGKDAGKDKGPKGGGAGAGTRPPPGETTPPSQGPGTTVVTPPPPVDLADEKCFANMPDGKRVEVPCN